MKGPHGTLARRVVAISTLRIATVFRRPGSLFLIESAGVGRANLVERIRSPKPTTIARRSRNNTDVGALEGMVEAAHPLALVVDDEELLRLFAAGLLEDRGFKVIEAENAAAALRALEAHHDVRLLFTDIQMPGALNGLDLAREVHARWPNVLLVITSGRARPRDAEIPDDGRFIEKPYGATDLFNEVDDLMRKS
jgi:two-component system, response regulator PdtaR